MNDHVDQTHRTFVSYIDKSRNYYLAQGFGNPYRWAYFDDAPFAPLPKPLAECRIALITTASLIREGGSGDTQLSKRVYSAPIDPAPDRLDTADLSWDKEATHTNDVESFLPIHRLEEFVTQGRIRSMAERFHGVPTEYSHRRTIDVDAPEILRRCREDGVDVAMLVPL